MSLARVAPVGLSPGVGVDPRRRCRASSGRGVGNVLSIPHHLPRCTRWVSAPPGCDAGTHARGSHTTTRAHRATANAVGVGNGTILLLSVHSKQPYGLQVGVVGDADVFGAWDPELGLRLRWTEGNIWTARVELPAGTSRLEYKLVTYHKTGFNDWEEFSNRTLRLDEAPVVTLSGNYEGPLRVNASVSVDGNSVTTAGETFTTGKQPNLKTKSTPTMPPPPPPPPSMEVPPPPTTRARKEARFIPTDTGNAFDTPDIDDDGERFYDERVDDDVSVPGGSTDDDPGVSVSRDSYREPPAVPPPPADPDPYAAFEQRVSATFAKLQSAAERTNARFTSDTRRWGGKTDSSSSAVSSRDGTDGNGEVSTSGSNVSSSRNGGCYMDTPPSATASTNDSQPGWYRESRGGDTTVASSSSSATRQRINGTFKYDAAAEMAADMAVPKFNIPPPPPPAVRREEDWGPPPESNAFDFFRPPPPPPIESPPPPVSVVVEYFPPPPPPPPRPPVVVESTNRLPTGAARTLASRDQGQNQSWIEKLALAASALALPGDNVKHYSSNSDASNPTVDETALAGVGLYLRWVGTCVVACGADGGGNNLAAASASARNLFVALESVSLPSPTAFALARRVHPWLPSISGEFSSEAGVGVLVSSANAVSRQTDLYPASFLATFRETVLNPLTRNAGPAALFASQQLLEKSKLAAGDQTVGTDLERFNEALARYHNRAPALDRLASIAEKGVFQNNPVASAAVAELADAMEALDLLAVSVVSVASRSNESAELDPTLRALQALGSVRAHFAAEVSSPLARGASSSDVSKRQAYRMAELSLEQTARTMLGRVEFLLGVCDSGDSGSDGSGSTGSTGGTDTFSHALTSNRSNAWGVACAAVAHAMRHVAHGGYKPAECFACANDLDALMELGGGICAPEDSKALIAALTRACRIAAQHDASLIHAYGDIPGLFAEALGVELDATVGSSKVSREVRNGSFVASLLHEGVPSSVVRLAEPMLRALSWRIAGDASKLQAHDACVVPGVCVGVMVEVDSLEFGALNTGGFGNTSRQPVVAFVRRATGDEDVSVASGGIRGIVCGSALRKLSRLAIGSARNEIPLTAASTPAGAANARGAAVAHLGEWVSLRVSPKSSLGVELRLATAGEIEDAMVAHETRDLRRMGTTGSMAQRLQVVPKLANVVRLGDLVHAKADRCGHKAQSLGDLRRIAKRPGAAFKTLPGLTLPFGTFDASLREQTGKQRALRAAVDLIEKALVTGDAKALKSACAEAYSVAKTVLPSPEIAAAICAAFIGEDPLGTGGGATGGGASNRSSTSATTTKVPLLIVRTSSLVEDPGACCGGDKGDPAGDLPSQIVSASKSRDVAGAVGRAWASQFLLSNVVRNAAAGVPIHDTTIAVVIQPLAPGTVTWEARRDDDESESSDGVSTSVSFVPGFGGWPKGAMDGEPCLVTVRHKDGVANTKQFSDVDWKNVVVMGSEVRREIAEYALESLSGTSSEAEEFRKNMARRITAVAVTLSSEFGTPQILEGCVVDDTLFVTRTRPQQPLGGK